MRPSLPVCPDEQTFSVPACISQKCRFCCKSRLSEDIYHRPSGKRLGTSGAVHEGKTLLYRASKLPCDVCPLKPQCCPKEPSRKIPRDIHEHARDVARSLKSGHRASRLTVTGTTSLKLLWCGAERSNCWNAEL